MRSVYKYKLDVEGNQYIVMPVGAKILSASFQKSDIFIWALVPSKNSNAKLERRRFFVFGTGGDVLPFDLEFIDTVFFEGLVFHVFEEML